MSGRETESNVKGKHRIILETARVKYDFTIRRNITVILGDSATGKTTLINYLNLYAQNGVGSGVKLQSDVPCFVFSGAQMYWRPVLESVKGSIIFIDEEYTFVFSTDFADLVRNSDNYFVLITREPLYNLPYSTKEVFGIRTSGKYQFPEKVYHEFYPVYSEAVPETAAGKKVLIIEDTGSGFEFFSKTLETTKCIAAGGNGKIVSCLEQTEPDSDVTVIADGAAYGPYMENLLSICRARGKVGIYLPESFEWMILKSGVLRNEGISTVLETPEEYIDTLSYFSWEQFFTTLLIKITAENRWTQYSKSHIPKVFLTERNQKLILASIPEEIRRMME
ncbi:translation initiation factor 2 [Butyrivibrio sp.]|uniref:translation initiation factor 2 n=1 Tax=Butyrivibrio sp. TaxID=28121 RepID=UPI0025BD96A7|nr:translation initiation factor 2 [Butyrivibrio sp.]MBQ9301559.1 translation initiation factor 2 [Butyrivibrio sp.]